MTGLLSSPFAEQEPVDYVPVHWDLSKNILCFVSSGYSLQLLNLAALNFFLLIRSGHYLFDMQ